MNTTVSDPVSSALVIFFVAIGVGLLLLALLTFIFHKGYARQQNMVDIYMEPLVNARTLHSIHDYRKAAFAKSRFLLFKKATWAYVLLVLLAAAFILYAYLHENFDFSFWAEDSLFGIEVAGYTTVWGMNLPYYFEQDYEYVFGWEQGLVVAWNVLTFVTLFVILWQTQGFLARTHRILSKKGDDYLPKVAQYQTYSTNNIAVNNNFSGPKPYDPNTPSKPLY